MENNTKLMGEQKELLTKQLEELQKKEQEFAKNLETIRANINGTLGALQYHEYLLTKLTETKKAEAVDATFEEITK